jgi:hypothetical protein
METSGCAPAEEYLCQAFSDVILAVSDVDADDGADPNLCSEYVKDIYAYLRQLEVSIVIAVCLLSLQLPGSIFLVLDLKVVQYTLGLFFCVFHIYIHRSVSLELTECWD